MRDPAGVAGWRSHSGRKKHPKACRVLRLVWVRAQSTFAVKGLPYDDFGTSIYTITGLTVSKIIKASTLSASVPINIT